MLIFDSYGNNSVQESVKLLCKRILNLTNNKVTEFHTYHAKAKYFEVNSCDKNNDYYYKINIINPYSTELFDLNFQSLKVVSHYRETRLQVTENLCYL